MFQKIYFTLIFMAIAISLVKGQDFSKEFGKIDKETIEFDAYEIDKDAEAVVLFDIGKSYFVEKSNSFDLVFERTTRIKIRSEAGIKYAEVEIPFYQEGNIYEKVYSIEAYTYNMEDGKLVRNSFDVSNTYDEKKNEYWNVKKFAIPNVKAGSVIEYRYKINSQYKFNFRDWAFQWRIPVIYSEYEVRMIPFYEYTFALQGANKLDVYESYEDKALARNYGSNGGYAEHSYHDMVYKFAMNNVPAFKDEEFITSMNDYVLKINFQLSAIHRLDGTNVDIITTWDGLIKELLRHPDFGKYLKKSERLASKLIDVKKLTQKSEKERVNSVIDYVKSNYSWNNYMSKFASKKPNELIDDKVGNCADINLFTVGLLRSVGIEAYPIILSTRDHGKIKLDYPFSHFFNYVAVLSVVDGVMMLSDASEVLSLNDRIPPRCLNDKALVIRKDKVDWIPLESMFTSDITTYMEMNFDNEALKVDLIKSATEYDALNFRNNYTNNAEKVKQKLSSKNYDIDDSSIKIQNYSDNTKPYKLMYSFTTKPEVVNGKIYLSPFLEESLTDNPFKQRERKYPLDMIYPKKRVLTSTIPIPEGYKVDYLPEDLTIKNELFELNYAVKTLGDKLQVVLNYYFKKPIYQSDKYIKIKYYFHEIVAKGNDKIVLVKSVESDN